ncbi:hypothetical protein [Paenibacillus sp. YN15]|uniref:hypothetical protein n=1 Tax=Paenibacillus sp. YN15 TaxID=1742774 RepID=UPI000DCCAAE7|nr:hypothetical protein [Paenibacillus sp. YN15]RAV04565.1 hypothetical protein DQG13_04940 [Paenibacillus sp. YN15]
MKVKNTLAIGGISMLLLLSLVIPSYTQAKPNDYVVGDEAITFLKEHNVDLTPFVKTTNLKNDSIYSEEDASESISKSALYNEEVLFLKKQAAVYQFTDEQIQNYVKGVVETTPILVHGKNASNQYSTMSTPYSSRIGDDGIGYEVVSSSAGFNAESAFLTIPSASIASSTSGYLFYSVSSPITNFIIDVGLWYGAGGATGNIVGWRGVYNSSTLGQHAVPSDGSTISALTPGKQVYMISQIREDGFLETKVLDASNFSISYLNFIYYVGDQNVWQTNGVFDRQITLCQNDAVFTNGSYLHNAKFS